VAKNADLAFDYFNKAMLKGVHEAGLDVGRCYENGVGVERDRNKAIVYYAINGTKKSYSELKRIGSTSVRAAIIASKNNMWWQCASIVESNALSHMEYCKKMGYDVDECVKLMGIVGDCYFEGKGRKQDYTEAIKYYKIGAETKFHVDAHSLRQLAECYEKGLGCVADSSKAEELRKMASIEDESNEFSKHSLVEELWTKYSNNKIVRENVDNIVMLVTLYDAATSWHHPWPPQEKTSEFRMGSGEVHHVSLEQGQHLYETVSSTNRQLKHVLTGKLAVTNKRFVFIAGDKLKSIPFREIERFSSNWLCGREGTITLSIKDRARSLVLRVCDAMYLSVIYWYYNSSEFRQKFDKHTAYDVFDLRRHELARWLYSKAEPGIDALMQKQNVPSVSSPGNSGTGCCVPFIVMIGAAIWLAKMCIC